MTAPTYAELMPTELELCQIVEKINNLKSMTVDKTDWKLVLDSRQNLAYNERS